MHALECGIRGKPYNKDRVSKTEVIVELDDPEPDDPAMVAVAAAAGQRTLRS